MEECSYEPIFFDRQTQWRQPWPCFIIPTSFSFFLFLQKAKSDKPGGRHFSRREKPNILKISVEQFTELSWGLQPADTTSNSEHWRSQKEERCLRQLNLGPLNHTICMLLGIWCIHMQSKSWFCSNSGYSSYTTLYYSWPKSPILLDTVSRLPIF